MARSNALFICSTNLSSSPTAERIYCDDPRLAVRSRGLGPKAARRISLEDLDWAEIIFVMEEAQLDQLQANYQEACPASKIRVLDIPERYPLMDLRLVTLLQEKVESLLKEHYGK
ncbi:phosphotyrosine protein phosphatase [bacterium]|nr:phosphotyrosine protein phosphatase [bacterium]